ncbi:MAG: 3'(2'),5'-bisphosphate nucleotidase [Deltaproteobacteria bacterium]
MDEYSPEVKTAIRAAMDASLLCQQVQKDLIGEVSFTKSDRSPVTIADYGSQAIICRLLKETFPKDSIIAEEDSVELRKLDYAANLAQVTRYVKDRIPGASPAEVCDWIGLSSHSLTERFWALDPIDGTKGFLRGDQYAIALALVENGEVKLGILACPNLHVDIQRPQDKRGCLFVAMRGEGSVQMDMDGGNKRTLSVSRIKDLSGAFFTESVEADHSDHLFHQQIARKFNISKPPLRMDSQVKYGIVARGEAVLYLRIPAPSEQGYKENIWDHAAGAIIAEEAGGRVTDAFGRPLDFSSGIKLAKNYGIVVTNGVLHDPVLKALGFRGKSA